MAASLVIEFLCLGLLLVMGRGIGSDRRFYMVKGKAVLWLGGGKIPGKDRSA